MVLSQVLVVLVCISSYDQSTKLRSLPGAELDRQRLNRLFCDKYKYNVISTKRTRVTRHDLEDTLYSAHREFRSNPYHALLVFYTGHGTGTHILTSEKDGRYPWEKFECYFNNYNIPSRSRSFKIYFIDSARGEAISTLITKSNVIHMGN